ncbi:gliding motility-associated C-terminal domain-containing protein [Flavobacterium sp. KS-LB2]|uniref:T9SS type B sorting domain-containing protein n=1 Tax=Flavobacterium sp. KS-LB2 TaxID=3120525 RepID=UPI0030D1CEE7
MKTKITLLLLTLFVFVGNTYSQFDAQHPDLRSCNYSCPSGNVTAKNVYLSATINDGTPLEDIYPTCIAGQDTYSVTIWLNYTQNQNNDIPNTRVFATLTIGGGTPIQINTYVGTLASTKGTSGGKIKLTTVPVNWVCGQTLSFTNVLVVWKPGNGDSQLNANSTYNCQTYTNSQCEFGTTTIFTAPLAVQYDYSISCATNTGVAVQFSNTTNGGKAPFTYLWNFGDGTTSTAISPLHNYTTSGVNVTATLTVTDSRTPTPATNTISKTINLPNKLTTSISQQTNVSCNGENNGSLTTMPSGGTLPYTYLWNSSPIQTSATATGLASGTYTITVTDAKGCITTSTATITQSAVLSASATTTAVLCKGGNGMVDLSVSGGTAPYTYLWSNGALSQDLAAVVAGTYNVTITDANNCTTTASATVTEPANALEASATTTAVLCKGGNGMVDLSVSGGTAPYTYLWSNGALSQDLAAVVAGTYNVTITDANNCTTTASATVTEPANALEASATTTAVLCKGGNGMVDLSVSGGTAPYTYLWSNGALSQDLAAVVAGTYNVTITDANNCTTTASATVTEPANALEASATTTAVLCKGGNGMVDLSVSGGTAPYTYLWSNGALSQDLAAVVAGTYNVTITDANNCTTTASATVTEPANALEASATTTAVLCKGGNGMVDLSVSGGTAPYTYLWSNGALSQDLAAVVAGTYNVTITDANNCTTTASATVTEPANALEASATTTAVLCKGGNGMVDLSVSGGTAPYTYLWSNGALSQDLAAVVAGTYNVTITDANNCTTTASATVTEPANALEASATTTAVLCKGGNGMVDLSVSGGTAPYTYLWSNGALSQDLAAVVAGTYNVTITDANNCTTTASATVTEPANALEASATTTAVLCKGGNGMVDLSVSGGTAPYTYLWNNGATSQDLAAVVAGTYNVTITDANNCTTTASATVTEPANALEASATTTAVLCKGGNGMVDLSVSGGTAPYTYLWSNGALSQDLAAVVAGTYNVTITDANNCTTTASATVTEPANALEASATTTAVLCKGGNGMVDLSVSGGTAPYTYLWSNGALSQDLAAVVAGTYNVTITDANNCTTTASATVTEPANALEASATTTAVLCKGGNGMVDLSVSGGTAPYTYLWSNGALSQDLAAVVAGTYNVTITDANNCTTTASATVTEPANALEASATTTAVLCKGGNGMVDLSVSGGTAPYTYLWSNGALSQDLAAVVAGTYNVTITDANNCTTTASATVTEPANALEASATTTAVLCKGGNGMVDLSVSGGTAPYTYLWSNGALSQDLAAVVAGTYNVTITDANNCTTTASATVTEPANALEASATTTAVLCKGGNGMVDLSVSGGTAPYTYLWSNGALSQDLAAVVAGTYNVTITDANNCTTTASATVTEPANALEASATTTAVLCKGGNGMVDLSVSGGTAPYTYLWSNGATSQDLAAVVAGTYNVTITDANNCTTTASATVTEPANALEASATTTAVLCKGGNGMVDLSVSGGTAPYTYLWNNGATSQDLAAVVAGTYNVTITDANNCTTTASATVTEPANALEASATTTAVLCKGGNGMVDLSVSGGTAPYTYLWSNGALSQDLAAVVAGTYNVTITDANNCTTTASATVTEPANALEASATTTAVLCKGGNGMVDLSVSGGTAPYTYLWSNGALSQDLAAVVAGTYNVTITDANNCTTTASATVTEPANALEASATTTAVLCKGGNGMVDLSVSGGTAPYTYLWSNGALSQDLAAVVAGTYNVTITDANNCTTTASATVTEPANALEASATTTAVLCKGGNGMVDLSVSGGTAPYTYLWSNGALSQDLAAVVAGTYNVTITDANNCTTTASATVTEPANALEASATTTAVLCKGGNGMVDLSVSGGTAPYTYLWSNGALSQDLAAVVAGTYNVTITDANNCTTTASATVTEPANALEASATTTAVLCKGGNGMVDLSVSGGTAPYTYLWSNGATSQDLAAVVAGTYNVTITDANNCTTTASATVTEPANALEASATTTAVLCKGGNGMVDLSVSGGTAPYTYLWNNGATSQDLAAVVAGTYNVTITDANNCTTTASATVTEPANALEASATTTAVLCKGGNGMVDLSVSGGTAPYTYLWSNGALSQDLAAVVAGTYNVTITDANNCTTTASATVTEPANALEASATTTAVLCKGGNGMVDLSVSGGTAPYTYLWSNGALSQDLAAVVAGTYNVTITDANNCTTTASATVTEPANALEASATTTAVLCKGGNGMVDLSVSGGTAPYTYLWSNGATSQDLAAVVAGTYNVTITDANNCTTTASATVTEPANALEASATTTAVLCKGGNGMVDLSVSGGTAPYTYLWNNGATSQDLAAVVAGTYNVTITDANNCTTTASATVTDGDGTPPVISQLPNEITINCPAKPEFAEANATDNVDISVSLTFDDVTTNGQCAGSYSITRTWTAVDDCGNSSTKSQTINVQDITSPTFTPPANITLSSGENCTTNTDPSVTGTVTTVNDTCDSNPIVTFIDTNCFGNSNNQEINAGNGNYFPFTVSGFDGISASSIEKIALAFETNQGKGRAEFTLIAPNGQGIILVGPYCTGGACDDTNSNTKELYLPVFYPNSSGYAKWNNSSFIQDGVSQNFTPNGATTSTNTIPELTSYVSSFENFTGSMNGTWLIYSRKQASVNGSIEFKSICLTPILCPGNKIISRTWKVSDACGNTATANQTIKIEDTTAPTASNPAAITLTGCNGTFPAADIAVVTDEADACSTPIVAFVGDSAPALVGCTETTIRTYSVTDACGNTINVTQNLIRTVDETAPTASNPAAITLTGCNGTFPAADIAVVTDEADACSTPIVAFVGDSAPALVGCTETTIRTYSVTDACGNTINVTQNLIRTVDETAPSASNPAAITLTGCNGTFPAADIAVVTDEADACSTPIVAFVGDSAPALVGCTETTIRTYSVTDACGNTINVTQNLIRTVDETAPTASNPAAITLTGCNGTFPAADIAVVTDEADACSTPIVAFVGDSAPALVGCTETTIRTYSVTDACGNTINVTQNLIRTVDETAPSASNPAAITLTGCNGTFPAADIAVVTDEADACSTPIVAFVGDSAPALVGCTETTIRTYSVTDACGNTINVTQNLIRTVDETAPTASNPAAITLTGCNGTFPAADIAVVTDEADACSTPIVAFVGDSAPALVGCTETTIRTYSVTDACGNTINVTQNLIRTVDETAPTASNPAAITLTGCNGTFPAADIAVVTDEADACSTPIVAFVGDSAPALVGCTETTIRTYSVTDACGNTINVTQNLIRTVDETAPTASNPAAITLTGCNGTFPAADIAVVTDEADACSTPIVAFVGDSAPALVGCTETTIRTYSVTDACGNTINVTQNLIRTVDETAPKFTETLPENVTVQCSNVPTAATLTATDNCGDATVTYDQTTTLGLCASTYTLTRTWTAKDTCGNTATHTQIVIVEDTIAPVFVEALPENVTVQCGAIPTPVTLTATDNCGDATVTYNQTTTSGLCASAYTLTRTWTAKDVCGNTATHTQIVTVEDTIAPVFVEALPENVTVQCSNVPTAATLTATDNCGNATVTYDQTTTLGLCASTYTLTRTWTAKDACGNTATHTQIVTVEDTIAPVFVEALPENVTVQCSNVPTAATLTATDNCGDATVTYDQTTTLGLCASTYTLTRTWTAKDACGNTATHTQIVTVEDTIAPVFVEALPENVTVQCGAIPTPVTLTATDNCGDATVTYNQATTSGLCAGTYTLTRTWIAKDTCGNTTTHTQTINIIDTNGPTTTTEFSSTVNTSCNAIPAKPELVFVDNCSAVTTAVYTETIINKTDNSYSIVRKWSVSDTCGNASEFIQIINVTVPNSIVTINSSVCNSGEITTANLRELLPVGTPTNGTWIDVNNSGSLQGDIFNASGLTDVNYTFEYKIDNACLETIRIVMTVNTDCGGIVLACGTVLVHNAFSPNGDGINEKFIIDNIDDTVCYPDNTVEIYNRWGVLVFETKGYNNTSNAFDGISGGRSTVQQSSGLPTGTYFYILNYTSVDNDGKIISNKKDGYLYLTK